ncbi:MAG: MoxR family ATPase [Acidobacteriota bacterium]
MTRASVRGRRGVMACATLLCAWRALGADGDMAEVRLPLERYDALVHGSRPDEPVLPAAYALGAARVTVNVSDPPRAIADAELSIRVPRDGWVAVPVLPAGTAVSSVTVGGAPAQLAALPLGLCWIAEKAGSYEMAISYRADASRSESGYGLGLPVPAASAITIDARLPGVDIDVSVIPSAGVTIAAAGGATTVSATVPTTTGVQIAWHAPGRTRPAIGRASYRGEIKGEAAAFTASLDVDCFTSESTTLPVLPGSATLRNIAVDGHDAPIVSEGANHATLIRGLGHHTVVVELEVPIVRGDGPARVEMDVLPIPVSRFEVRMAGKKDLQVVPAADVAQRLEGGATVATMFVPQTSHVTLRWAEAVPEEIKAEVQWSASITHVVSASEGLLQVHAYLAYEVTRGESNVVSLDVPREVEVNRISSPSGAVVDWRDAAPPGQPRRIDVFLDRKVRGELPIEVLYDRPLVEGAPTALPLLRAIGPQRQHGIVVLLAGREVSLSPGDVGAAVRVGENQIPGSLRETLGSPVTHTLKYPGDPPGMTVVAAPPEKKPARFDASVETLVSVGEAALRGCAIVQLDVKSSAIGELSLALPPDVTLLGLSGPSIREHTVVASEGAQQIAVMFTEEMEGRCRIELSWERLFPGDRASVPLVTVGGADVEQGRVAVESLSAAEVKAAAASNVTAIDVGELPRELVLRTANPILLAYRYAHARSAPEITLEVTRHRVVGVLEAVIEEAAYRTLVTRDGLLVTTADFVVKNSRQQFLRVALPAGSTVWSALVDGRREARDGRGIVRCDPRQDRQLDARLPGADRLPDEGTTHRPSRDRPCDARPAGGHPGHAHALGRLSPRRVHLRRSEEQHGPRHADAPVGSARAAAGTRRARDGARDRRSRVGQALRVREALREPGRRRCLALDRLRIAGGSACGAGGRPVRDASGLGGSLDAARRRRAPCGAHRDGGGARDDRRRRLGLRRQRASRRRHVDRRGRSHRRGGRLAPRPEEVVMRAALAPPELSLTLEALESVVLGKRHAASACLVALLSEGHVLVEDTPGLGKTTLARGIARVLGLSARRIQFTSDLLPSDVTGVSVYDPGTGAFVFREGPVFCNVLLADEINRSGPRTQSALLEAMSEGTVSAERETRALPRPFMVIATQNPIEHHGTYPLPDSELDRFLLRIRMGYPAQAEERRMIEDRRLRDPLDGLEPVLSRELVLDLVARARRVVCRDAVMDYLLRVVGATRCHGGIEIGCSPRGSLMWFRAAQARAFLEGRSAVLPDDLKALAIPVLAHRLVLRAGAPAGAAERLVGEICDTVPVLS